MEKICQIDECEKPSSKGPNCQMHYLRIKKHGTPHWSRPTLEDRFWAKVTKTDSCWLWTGAPTKNGGYGSLNIGRTPTPAHRISYEMANGPIPDGMQIDHMCHTPLCVNPSHLRPVNHKQNGENHQGATSASKSGIRGVYWHADGRKWTGQVGHNGVRYNAGMHNSIAEAEAAVVALRNRLFTHNDIDRIAA